VRPSQTTLGGMRGEYDDYRIVSFSDSKGNIHRLWAVVEFEMFRFRRVRWRADQKDSLPSAILPLLETEPDRKVQQAAGAGT